MIVYPFVIFVHVLGAVGIFAAIAVEAVSVGRLQRAGTPADARVWMGLLALPGRLGPIAMVTTLLSGMWMMAVSWGREPWIVTAFVGIVAMAAMGGAITARRMRRLRVAMGAETGPELSDAFRELRSSPALTASLRLRIAIGIGILGLMTVKPPDAATSSLILAAAVASGVMASVVPLPARRSRQPRTTEA
jgi:hypothetical protein